MTPDRIPGTLPAPGAYEGPPATQLLMGLAHDLRSPLTAILALSESLLEERGGPLTHSQRHQLSLIYTSALVLCETTNDALDLVRQDGDRRRSVRAPFAVDLAMDEVKAIVMPMAEERGTAMEVVCPVQGKRMGDSRALRRALLNLATNALKAAEHGSVQLVARDAATGRVEFTVTDTGPGLDLAGLKALWEPDAVEPRRSGAVQGTRALLSSAGLGLMICRNLVETMGGELMVETQPGAGSSFFFQVPLPMAS